MPTGVRGGRLRIALLAACLLLAGCREAGQGAPVEPIPTGATPAPTSGTASPRESPSEASEDPGPGLDPAMAVERPGPRVGRRWSADLLVFGQVAVAEDTLDRLAEVEGVAAVEPLALGQVTIENRAVNVAAVDPATFRNFTELADKRVVWDRVADGELSIRPRLRRKVDDAGYLQLGAAVDAPAVHVGTLARQVPQIDVVVNRKWGEQLGMTGGNAVLLSTGLTAPAKVRRAVQQVVGDDVSVQRLDVAARLGLDTSAAVQTAFLTGGSLGSVVGPFSYTVLGGGRIAPDERWVRSHIATERVPILGTMTCNRALFPQLRAALAEIEDLGLAGEIHPDEYAGCYYPRFIAGTRTLSNHAFGLAFDINVPGNQRGSVGEIDRRVVAVFEKWGFGWGGRWSWTDPMHFELAQLVEPR